MRTDFTDFIRERDSALRSLDEEKIKAYMAKWCARYPENTQVFWASVHKARLGITSFTEEEKEISRKWLREHGFKPVAPY